MDKETRAILTQTKTKIIAFWPVWKIRAHLQEAFPWKMEDEISQELEQWAELKKHYEKQGLNN